MSTNGVSTSEDVDMAENEGDKIVTMMDVLQEQQEFEEDANAVLGASDEKNCTFPKGYIKRQAIYACLTCCSEAKTDPTKRAGVCLACSLMCHENHELVELYTKRNFCCDCGNTKFNSHPCQFTPNKTDLNDENSYNQNFSGVYCVCHRPYPDPESTIEDEMIQCIICEDWLHTSHLEATVPPNDQYSEMICKVCMKNNEFLHYYSDIAVNTDSVDVDVVTIKTNTENNDTVPNDKLNTEEHIKDSETDPPQNTNEKSVKDNIDAEMAQDKTEKCETHCNTDSVSDNMDVEQNNQGVNEDLLKPETKEVPIQTNSSTEGQQTDMNTDKVDTSQKSDSVSNTEQKELEPTGPNDKTDMNITESCDNSKENDTEPSQEESVETENSAIVNEQEKPVADEITPESTTNEMKNETDIEAQVTEFDQEKTNDNSTVSDKTLQSTTKIDENKQYMDTEEKDKINEKVEADCTTNNLIQNPENTSQNKETEHKSENESPNEEKENELETINKTEGNIENTDTPIAEDKTEKSTSEAKITESTSDTEQNVTTNQDIMVTDNCDNSTKNDITDDTENKTDIANNAEMDVITNKSESSGIENKIFSSNETNADEIANEHKRKLSIEATEEISVKKPKHDETKKCTRPQGIKKIFKGATFWPSTFRQVLCTCNECISMYKDLSVLFLIDPEDTVTAYENLGKERINGGPASQYEKGLQALSSLDRVQQINALTEYNKMRDKLLDFLKSFKDRREIVKEEDIKAFFAGMKPKREPDGVYFCR